MMNDDNMSMGSSTQSSGTTEENFMKFDNVSGELRVTVTFDVLIYDLSHYEATTIEEAATNLLSWYRDGSADFIADMTVSSSSDTTINVEVKGGDINI